MLIKRFYLQLIDEYFTKATFFKPTGDGMLIVFPYGEKTLRTMAAEVIETTLRCLDEFPSMLLDDPMINFATPENLGFGISRGTACCLHSGRTIIDYSGHLLNLAARLMDLARPSGVVIDGAFGANLLPDAHRDRFDSADVYIRSLAESEPVQALYLKESVKISPEALRPLREKKWKIHKREFKVADIRKLGKFFLIDLPDRANEDEPITVTLRHPMIRNGRVLKGYYTNHPHKEFTIKSDHTGSQVRVDFYAAADYLENERVPRTRVITFKIDYVAAP